MNNPKQNLVSLNIPFNTLEQKGTKKQSKLNTHEVRIIQGTGSSKESIKKRPKRKFISQSLALALVDVAKEENSEIWTKRYWSTYHCQNSLVTHDGRAYGNYCKRRWCTVCASIKKADMINKYLPIMKDWEDMHFLTLTVKSKSKQSLQMWMDGMFRAFDLIIRRCRRRHQRGKGPKLIGIRCLECCFNPIRKTYNPHFHILTANKEIAELVKKEWCELWTFKYARPHLQVNIKVKNTEKDMIEVIKYGAKVFTDPEVKKGKSGNWKIYAAALHEIYKVFDGRKLISKFGFKTNEQISQSSSSRVINDFKDWSYDSKLKDWIEEDTGQIMTNYIPTHELEILLDDFIDIEST